MLSPKKQKYRKAHKGRVGSRSKAGTMLAFGSFGLKSIDGSRVSARQIEAARQAAVRHMKRQGKFWINIFPDIPVSKKPAEVRMGKGKGSPEFWVAVIRPGRVLFEMEGVPKETAQEALRLASHKLSISTQFCERRGAAYAS